MIHASLRNIDCFVFDMDGTLYLGDSVLPGAHELIDLLEKRGIQYYYFTNNSSRSPREYTKRLENLGFVPPSTDKIMTSGHVMIHYIKSHYSDPGVFLCGTPALQEQFKGANITLLPYDAKKADAVVIGFDTTMDYIKADNACRLISGGADFLATNIDRVCPLDNGRYMLDCGSMCKMIEHATGVQPKFTGKPFAETVDYILNKAGSERSRTALVGDRLYTDIMTAVNGDLVSIAVLSGEVTLDELKQSNVKIDYILDSVKDIYDSLL